jgi:hypothetical protein
VSPKGHWGRRSLGGRNVNQLTSDHLSDVGGSSSFHGTRPLVAPTADEDSGRVALTLGDRATVTVP